MYHSIWERATNPPTFRSRCSHITEIDWNLARSSSKLAVHLRYVVGARLIPEYLTKYIVVMFALHRLACLQIFRSGVLFFVFILGFVVRVEVFAVETVEGGRPSAISSVHLLARIIAPRHVT